MPDGIKPSLVVLHEKEEQIRDLKLLVQAYDNYLYELMPHAYRYFAKPFQLRQEARQEGIDIKEPQP